MGSSLPSKDLMRLKSVCKDWMTIICNPRFAKEHLSHFLSNPAASYILILLNGVSVAAQERNLPNFKVPANKVLFQTHRPCSNSVNGLICFQPKNQNSYTIVYNLSTWEKRNLPPEKIEEGYKYALGFDHSSQNYKILHFGGKRGCEVLTLERQSSWRTVVDEPQFRTERAFESSGPIYCEGKIYFNKSYQNSEGYVHYFNVENERFGTIVVPPLDDGLYTHAPVVEVGPNNLGFVAWKYQRPCSPECRFWVWDQNQTWDLRWRFSMSSMATIWGSIEIGEIVIGVSKLFLYDVDTFTKKKLKGRLQGIIRTFSAIMWRTHFHYQ
ncbi:unnamed protein product [Cuscuta epithymum]|uniref:F-box associated beta-propeller type 3 domain-containing protein n=1 Tax=Cuscuta epithymum TaxID=186058 RepID=A0AAV0GHU7_9ASTE|nr:unnamed protein product [Cuscuta epithymum]CAH9147435.1 unnamed protein product [Cuscuta epithymum]